MLGDDAPYLLVTDTSWKQLDTARFHADTAFRTGKGTKPDVESSTILQIDGKPVLLAAGSFSTDARRYMFYFPLDNIHAHRAYEDTIMAKSLRKLNDPNIEGCAAVANVLLYAQRGNNTNRQNYLLAGSHPEGGSVSLQRIKLNLGNDSLAGISGLHYIEEADLLLFTASEEDTPNAYEDGAISDSYLGFIFNVRQRMGSATLNPDMMIRLGAVHPSMARQKIESVCSIPDGKNKWNLFLVADNDDGASGVFSLRLLL